MQKNFFNKSFNYYLFDLQLIPLCKIRFHLLVFVEYSILIIDSTQNLILTIKLIYRTHQF